MASNTGVRTELYRDQFRDLLEDLSNHMLELKWLDGSSAMTDEDFKAFLASRRLVRSWRLTDSGAAR
jgi:hypothetical protein